MSKGKEYMQAAEGGWMTDAYLEYMRSVFSGKNLKKEQLGPAHYFGEIKPFGELKPINPPTFDYWSAWDVSGSWETPKKPKEKSLSSPIFSVPMTLP